MSDSTSTKNLNGLRSNRRTVLGTAARMGLVLPAIAGAGLHLTRAQDDATPEADADYVGSHGDMTGGTGTAVPAPLTVVPFQRFDPKLPSVDAGDKTVDLKVIDNIVQTIAPDVQYAGWTFNGTIPGPVQRVRVGDKVTVKFSISEDANYHSLDLHAARVAPDTHYQTIGPGENIEYDFVPKYPGAFMYHCGTPPVLMHIGAGMYGAIIVDPKEGWSPAQEICLVQSEIYLTPSEDDPSVMIPNYTSMFSATPDYVAFNGNTQQYIDEPIEVKVGEPVRIFVMNAGPNVWCSFHVVGAIFDAGYLNASPNNKFTGLQSISIGPGDGACVEFVLDEPGIYPAVNHAFGHAAHGAIALIKAVA